MDFTNIFRGFFGFNKFSRDDESNDSFQNNTEIDDLFDDKFKESTISELHQFFERQLHDILENFGMPNMPSFFQSEIIPSEIPDVEISTPSARYNLLKPGYEDTSKEHSPPVDSDIDEKFNSGQLEKILDKKDVVPVVPERNPNRTFYSRSIISRTIVNPDGTRVTEKMVTDQDGNVEKTITHEPPSGNFNEPINTPNPQFPFKFF